LPARRENHSLFGGAMTLKVTPWTVRIGWHQWYSIVFFWQRSYVRGWCNIKQKSIMYVNFRRIITISFNRCQQKKHEVTILMHGVQLEIAFTWFWTSFRTETLISLEYKLNNYFYETTRTSLSSNKKG
jgi:hypothetical protein